MRRAESPYPLPYPVVSTDTRQASSLGGRRRARGSLRIAVGQWLLVLIGALNFMASGLCGLRGRLGCRKLAADRDGGVPCDLRRGQVGPVDHLRSAVRTFCRLGCGSVEALGRFGSKKESLEDVLIDVQNRAAALEKVFDCSADRPAARRYDQGFLSGEGAGTTKALDIHADRIKFETEPSFDPSPHLTHPKLRRGYEDPGTLRLASPPAPPRVRVRCSKAERQALYRKWDKHSVCALQLAKYSDPKYRGGLFAVTKDLFLDRLINNSKPENSREESIQDECPRMPHGSMLVDLILPPDKDLLISKEDLVDFYHSFLVSLKRLRRNHIQGTFKGSEFRGWRCYNAAWDQEIVVVCFGTQGMGDHLAVEVAQSSHLHVLEEVGGMRPEERLIYRRPLPRSQFLEALAVDDHLGLQFVRRGAPPGPGPATRRDAQVFLACEAAYTRNGMKAHQKKRVRGAPNEMILGSETRGRAGDVASPRVRTAALVDITITMLVLGITDMGTLASVLGCWVSAVLYRRSALCLLDQTFKFICTLNVGALYRLPAVVLQELALLVACAPMLFTNIRAQVSSMLWCLDASPRKGALCAAQCSQTLLTEVYRHAEKRGFFTRLESPLGVAAKTLLNDERGEFVAAPPARKTASRVEWDVIRVGGPDGDRLCVTGAELGKRVHEGWSDVDPIGGGLDCPRIFREYCLLAQRRVCRVWVFCVDWTKLKNERTSSLCTAFSLLAGLVDFVGDWFLGAIPSSLCQQSRPLLGLLQSRARAAFCGRLAWLSNGLPLPQSGPERPLRTEAQCGTVPIELARQIFEFVRSEEFDESTLFRRWEDDPVWCAELACFPEFQLVAVWEFRRPGHINVLEVKVYRTLVRTAGRRTPSSRHVGLQDTRVGIGAEGKGRSGSPAINFQLILSLPYVFAFDFYYGPLHVRSHLNASDDPTRDEELRPPSIEKPTWASHVESGNFEIFDDLLKGDSLFRAPWARWRRVLFQLQRNS